MEGAPQALIWVGWDDHPSLFPWGTNAGMVIPAYGPRYLRMNTVAWGLSL